MRAGGRMLAKPPSMLRTGARLAGEPNEPSVPIDLATEWVKPDAARLQDGGCPYVLSQAARAVGSGLGTVVGGW